MRNSIPNSWASIVIQRINSTIATSHLLRNPKKSFENKKKARELREKNNGPQMSCAGTKARTCIYGKRNKTEMAKEIEYFLHKLSFESFVFVGKFWQWCDESCTKFITERTLHNYFLIHLQFIQTLTKRNQTFYHQNSAVLYFPTTFRPPHLLKAIVTGIKIQYIAFIVIIMEFHNAIIYIKKFFLFHFLLLDRIEFCSLTGENSRSFFSIYDALAESVAKQTNKNDNGIIISYHMAVA